ncbi:hypothetical protein BJX63DRAFT_223325 [Aspergillus granulosus]|uniref:Uncharacterized protein n=1 Tax=Aspergillus granulosus TaxID=176169 RepID=A0ABR4I1L8_9EURO
MPKPQTRIISICCKSSLDPLGITQAAMQQLIDTYDIDDSFFDHVLCFGRKPRNSDAGHGGMVVKERNDGSFDMHYRFTYTESNKIRGTLKFKSRQVCVFHRHSSDEIGNLWIFLHSRPDSELASNLERTLRGPVPDWFSLHLLVLKTYVKNWRSCLHSVGEDIEKAAEIALTMDLSNAVNIMTENDSLALLLQPQYLGIKLTPLSMQLDVTLIAVRKLADINTLFVSKGLSTLTQSRRLANLTVYYTSCLEGNLKSVEALERKVQGISNLLATTLTLNNQTRMLHLTDVSVEDNVNVFVVTLVTLVYLPASFVSTFLGMNLFDFDGSDHKGFTISKKFWVFLVAALPLTCLTMGFWYFLTKQRQRKRKSVKSESD